MPAVSRRCPRRIPVLRPVRGCSPDREGSDPAGGIGVVASLPAGRIAQKTAMRLSVMPTR